MTPGEEGTIPGQNIWGTLLVTLLEGMSVCSHCVKLNTSKEKRRLLNISDNCCGLLIFFICCLLYVGETSESPKYFIKFVALFQCLHLSQRKQK